MLVYSAQFQNEKGDVLKVFYDNDIEDTIFKYYHANGKRAFKTFTCPYWDCPTKDLCKCVNDGFYPIWLHDDLIYNLKEELKDSFEEIMEMPKALKNFIGE